MTEAFSFTYALVMCYLPAAQSSKEILTPFCQVEEKLLASARLIAQSHSIRARSRICTWILLVYVPINCSPLAEKHGNK